MMKDSNIIQIMVKTKLASSRSEAKRLIGQGAVELNGKVIDSIDCKIEPGVLKVGKRKFLRIRHFSRSNAHFDSGGYLAVDIVPLNKNPSKKEICTAVSEALADAIFQMDSRNYLSKPIQHPNADSLASFLFRLIEDDLIYYQTYNENNIEVDLWADGYTQSAKEVYDYIQKQNIALQEIKNNQLKNNQLVDLKFKKLKCPNCGKAELRCAYNITVSHDSNKMYNANGVCDSCGFKFNHFV